MLFLLHARSSQDALPLGLGHFSSFLFSVGSLRAHIDWIVSMCPKWFTRNKQLIESRYEIIGKKINSDISNRDSATYFSKSDQNWPKMWKSEALLSSAKGVVALWRISPNIEAEPKI